MMTPQPLVKFLYLNQCFDCGGEMVVVETETNLLRIDRSGLPIDTMNILVDLSLKCIKCNRTCEVDLVSMRYIERKDRSLIANKTKRNPFGHY